MDKVEWIIFDFGGVIGKPQDEKQVDIMVGLSGMEKDNFLENYFKERSDYDKGLISLKDYWSRILSESKVQITDGLLERLGGADAASWCDFNGDTIELIKELIDSGEKLALLSNINQPILDYLKRETRVLSLFDRLFCSCELKLLKPGAEIYEHVIKALGVKADQCIFIDDTLANVEGAVLVGIKGVHYQSVSKLREELRINH